MCYDPTGEIQDDNPIDEDYNGIEQDVEVTCAYCGQPFIVSSKYEDDTNFCDEECELVYYRKENY